ncbi:MAG: portal protein [Sphaerochaeta sp.]|jgi:hypothetical protein|nr:portal protein [Sphaerochaeta sp.]
MAEDNRAQQIIRDWQHCDSEAANTMNLYQQVADHFFLRENQITQKTTPGEDKSLPIIDPTGMHALQKMAAGLSAVIFPSGQYFCRLTPDDMRLVDDEESITYLNRVTEKLHLEMFKPACNFNLQINESIYSWCGLGTCNIFSGWDKEKLILKYKDWDVANYRFGVDANDIPNRCMIRWEYTARQAYDLFGESAGPKIAACVKDERNPQEEYKKFWFIYRVQQNYGRNAALSDNQNYKFIEEIVNESEKIIVQKNGYHEFPFHIARWLVGSQEIWGRGQGTYALSADKELQHLAKALNLCVDLHNNPPREVLSSFEGPPRVHPGAYNVAMEPNSIRALDPMLNGNFPISEKMLQMKQEQIRDYFYVKVFAPLDNLPGDRRTTVEIIERVKAGYMQLVLPVTRFYNECLTPLVERSVMLLLRNFRIPAPPAQLRGFKVEYLGRLALALQEQQADALQRFSQFGVNMNAVFPNFMVDTLNPDRAGRRMATVFGVNESDLNTDEEKAAIRQKRAADEQQMKMMMAAEAGSKAIKNTSQKPEEGSPAEQLLAGVGA